MSLDENRRIRRVHHEIYSQLYRRRVILIHSSYTVCFLVVITTITCNSSISFIITPLLINSSCKYFSEHSEWSNSPTTKVVLVLSLIKLFTNLCSTSKPLGMNKLSHLFRLGMLGLTSQARARHAFKALGEAEVRKTRMQRTPSNTAWILWCWVVWAVPPTQDRNQNREEILPTDHPCAGHRGSQHYAYTALEP